VAAERRVTALQARSSRGLHGPERTLLELAPALAARGVDAPFLALYRRRPGDPPEHPWIAAARAGGLPAASAPDPGPLHRAARQALAARLAAPAPDLVHTHDYRTDVLVATLARARRARGIPWILTVHLHTAATARLRLYRRLGLWAARRADQVVAVSAAQGTDLARRGVAPERIAVVRTAVDAPALIAAAARAGGPAAARARHGLPADAPLVALVGRLTRQKGVDTLLAAWPALRAAAPGARLVVVGDGPEADALAARAAALGVADEVRWTGALGDPLALMAAADVVAIPSRAEGLPRVALEAGALGRPVVAAAVGGLPEVVVDGVTGLLVPPEDPPRLAAALARLLGDGDLRRALGGAAAAQVGTRFALADAADAYAALYRAARRRPARGGR